MQDSSLQYFASYERSLTNPLVNVAFALLPRLSVLVLALMTAHCPDLDKLNEIVLSKVFSGRRGWITTAASMFGARPARPAWLFLWD